MDGGRLTVIDPGVTTGCADGDAVTAYPQSTIIDLPQREAFEDDIRQRTGPEPVYHRADAAQIPQPFLADISHQPQVARQSPVSFPESPNQPEQTCHTERVIANAGSKDAVCFALNVQINVGKENGVQMSADHQFPAGPATRQPGINIPGCIHFNVCKPFFGETQAHEFSPVIFVEGGGGYLLDGDGQVDYPGG